MGDAASGPGWVSTDEGRGTVVEARPQDGAWPQLQPQPQPQAPAITVAAGGGRGKPAGDAPQAVAAGATSQMDASGALSALYSAHYRSLVRMAALLVGDLATAEEVVQDSFVAMHANWRRLRGTSKALGYVRRCVINRCRSVLPYAAGGPDTRPWPPGAGKGAPLERAAVVAALHRLSGRQREVLVLRYYAELPEAEIASAVGISRGAVKSHTTRAMSALRDALEREP